MTKDSKNLTFFVSSEWELKPCNFCRSFQAKPTCPSNSNAQTTFFSSYCANTTDYYVQYIHTPTDHLVAYSPTQMCNLVGLR